jgi:hypothetical protein|nr:MAG TPA: hypothetical protein [Caudoviricetes sp.]
MERLTERTADGILVKENHVENGLRTFYQCFEEKPNDKYTNCDGGYCAIEKLSAYEDAEEQGLLIRLPCKVGSNIYRITDDGVDVAVCREIRVADEEMYIESVTLCDWISFDEIGKTVFLTEAEAEAVPRK